jgi:hypothetical protein
LRADAEGPRELGLAGIDEHAPVEQQGNRKAAVSDAGVPQQRLADVAVVRIEAEGQPVAVEVVAQPG